MVLLVAAAVSVQGSSALATAMFDRVGAAGAAWLRLSAGAIVLGLLGGAWRRRSRAAPPGAVRAAIVLGLSLAGMNTLFYGAIERLPLGVAVAIELVGPLAVAAAFLRRRRDLAWVLLAAAAIATLTLPRSDLGGAEALGVVLAIAAGACWAVFILAAARVGRAWPDGRGLLVGVAVGAVVTTPGGIASAAGGLDLRIVLLAVAVGVLGSALPYSLEIAALRRIGAGAFGVMMAIEPAVATLVGLVLLAQVPSLSDLLGIAGVAVAVWGAWRAAPPEPGAHA